MLVGHRWKLLGRACEHARLEQRKAEVSEAEATQVPVQQGKKTMMQQQQSLPRSMNLCRARAAAPSAAPSKRRVRAEAAAALQAQHSPAESTCYCALTFDAM